MVTFIDLFAGAGGATEGFKQSGMVPIGAVEWDTYAFESYMMNHGDHILHWDIRHLDWPSLVFSFGRPAHMHFSPPCQDFSINGRQEGFAGNRGGLMWEPVRLLEEAAQFGELPLTISMENVKGLLGNKHLLSYVAWLEALERLGYTLKGAVVNMADFGVPQTRERAILVGSLRPGLQLPAPTHRKAEWVTGAEALGVASSPYYFVDDAYNKPSRDNKPRVYDLSVRPAPTIDARTGARPKLGSSMEELTRGTVENWKALQTFPQEYRFSGAPSRQAQQVGNACPPAYFRVLGQRIIEFHNNLM